MIPVNRETVLTVATIVCILALVYLFKELNKTKEEMGNFKNFSTQVVRHLSPPPKKLETVPEPEPEPKSEDVKSDE